MLQQIVLVTVTNISAYVITLTIREIAGSNPDDVTGISHPHNPSGRTMALWLPHLTEMSTRNISWAGKGGLCVGLTTLPPPCTE